MTAKAACFSTQRREDTKILKYFKVALADVSKLFIIRTRVTETQSHIVLCVSATLCSIQYIIR